MSKSPAEILQEVGRALYGEEWKGPFAKDIGVNRDTIRYWLNGKMTLRPDHFATLHDMIVKREAELRAARKAVEPMLKANGSIQPTKRSPPRRD